MSILTCKDKDTKDFLAGRRVRTFQAIERQAQKALTRLQAATRLIDLRNAPSNRFEALHGDRAGQYSIRINDQWRVCFRWRSVEPILEGMDLLMAAGESVDVEITDYH